MALALKALRKLVRGSDPVARHYPAVRSLLSLTSTHPIEVRTSNIPNAGVGVFATADIDENTVVLLFPGVFHPPPVIGVLGTDNQPPVLLSELGKSEYGANCTSVGGALEPIHVVDREHALHAVTPEWVRRSWGNLAANGHNLNHGVGEMESLKPFWFYWRDALHEEGGRGEGGGGGASRWSVPNHLSSKCPWYFDEGEGRVVERPDNEGWDEEHEIRVGLVGMAFVTTRNVQRGEELMFDYQLNPHGRRPEWYSRDDL